MPTKPKPNRTLIAAVALATILSVVVAPSAVARIMVNTVDPAATLAGRDVVVTVIAASCTEGDRNSIRVTVTQRSTGALAEGVGFVACAGGGPQRWQVRATTIGRQTFQPGAATAVALARTEARDQAPDAHQWLVNVILADGK